MSTAPQNVDEFREYVRSFFDGVPALVEGPGAGSGGSGGRDDEHEDEDGGGRTVARAKRGELRSTMPASPDSGTPSTPVDLARTPFGTGCTRRRAADGSPRTDPRG